ncbi:MAG: molybdopterin molybdotransferase MoeA [Thiotrichales bacterium]
MTSQAISPTSCDAPQHDVLTKDQALQRLLESLPAITETMEIPVDQALGRVIAEDLCSEIDIPGHDNSAMDGYLVRSADTVDKGVKLKITQRIAAGSVGTEVSPGTAARIFTGAPIAQGGDAIVMQEECVVEGEWVTINRKVKPGENIRPQGNDVKAGDQLITAGTRLTPMHLAVIASTGRASVSVLRPLRAAILYTGDELVEPGNPLPAGKIYNSNRFALTGLLQSLQCELSLIEHVPDNFEATKQALKKAAQKADLIVSTGGVSVGGEDHIKPALEAVGQLNLWKIAIKPGKPLAYGQIDRAVFLGLPGNPVSTFVTFLLFVRPAILKMQQADPASPAFQLVTADFNWGKKGSRREYVRARLTHDEQGNASAVLFSRQGSDVNSALTWAHGLVEIPEYTAIEAGQTVRYYSFNEYLGMQ